MNSRLKEAKMKIPTKSSDFQKPQPSKPNINKNKFEQQEKWLLQSSAFLFYNKK